MRMLVEILLVIFHILLERIPGQLRGRTKQCNFNNLPDALDFHCCTLELDVVKKISDMFQRLFKLRIRLRGS